MQLFHHFILLAAAFTGLLMISHVSATAQNSSGSEEPSLPQSIEGLVDKGAQVKYLGKAHGMDGWIMIHKGQEQYIYVTPDKKAFLSGLLFSEDGTPLTVKQVQNLKETGRAGIIDKILSRQKARDLPDTLIENRQRLEKTQDNPAENLMRDVREGNWVVFGDKAAPAVYAFIDPTCPHCHNFVNKLRNGYLDKGALQLRVLPVSRADKKEIFQKAAFILVSPDPETDFYTYLDGQESALPADGDLNTQAVQQNMAIMQKWGLDAIPFIIYRDGNGEVKIIRGEVSSPEILVRDIK